MSHFDNIFNFLKRKNHTQTSTGAILKACTTDKDIIFHSQYQAQQVPTISVGSTVKLCYDCSEFPCPKMIVKELHSESAVCLWFNDLTQIEVAEFPKELLRIC